MFYGQGHSRYIKGWYEKSGWEVLGQDEFPQARPISIGIDESKAKGAQILFVCLICAEWHLVKQYKTSRFRLDGGYVLR
jgi:hypothetical protein